MIIFGTTTTTKQVGSGDFYCPHCATRRPYALRRMKRWFHLYWIPTIPMRELSRWVECVQCHGQYTLEALAYDPGARARAFEGAFHAASRTLLVRAALLGGAPEAATLQALAQALGNLTGRDVTADEVGREVEAAQTQAAQGAQPLPPAVVLAPLAGGLSEHGKEVLARALVHVASAAAGALSPAAQALVGEVGQAVDMSQAHLRGVIAETLHRAA